MADFDLSDPGVVTRHKSYVNIIVDATVPQANYSNIAAGGSQGAVADGFTSSFGGNSVQFTDEDVSVFKYSPPFSIRSCVLVVLRSVTSSIFRGWRRFRRLPGMRQILLVVLFLLSIFGLLQDNFIRLTLGFLNWKQVDVYYPPMIAEREAGAAGPDQWLRDNIHLDAKYAATPKQLQVLQATRPKAAIISLVRNSELEGMIASVSQLEARFNGRQTHQYDWVFFNDEEFTEEFKARISNATSANCFFETIPAKHWNMPDWIDKARYDAGREFLGRIKVGKAWLQSYHQMCRWNSGLFALEEILQNYDWFWRVEPGVQFTCNVDYDVFRFMQDNNLVYGFNMAILDDARSFPSLWQRTLDFMKYNPDAVHPRADMGWLLHDTPGPDGIDIVRAPTFSGTGGDGEYNNCQFYSNFEIASLNFFRSKEHQDYFEELDKAGGFFYERIGDAPVHTLSVSMFLPKTSVWYFRDIGYAHGICEQCPPHTDELSIASDPKMAVALKMSNAERRDWEHRTNMIRDMSRQKRIPGLRCGCTTNNFDINHSKLVPFESKQRKPLDTCIRRWLGGKWLTLKEDYYEVAEMVPGGPDAGTYILSGLESNPYREIDNLEARLDAATLS